MGAQVETQAHSPQKIIGEKTEVNEASISQISVETIIKLEERDLTIVTEVSICNKPVKFLIDSGAHATIINFKTLKQNILYYPQIKYCMTGINGPEKAIKTHGATYGNIMLNGIKLRQQMQIAGDDIHLNYDGILGLDFLYTYGTIMNLRNLTMKMLLPAWHELYEKTERDALEKKWLNTNKKILKNELVYSPSKPKNAFNCKNEPPKTERNTKKFEKVMQAQINRLSLIDLSKKIIKKSIKIMPHSERNVRIATVKPLLCKAKEHSVGVFSADTIVDKTRNILTIYNSTHKIVELENPEVDTEEVESYHIFHIKNKIKTNDDSRIKYILNKLDTSHCGKSEREIIERLVNEFHDVFHVEGDGLTFAKDGEHRIFTKPDATPVNTRQYKIPHAQWEIVNTKINEMLADGIIEKSTSMWNSPLLLVPKKSMNNTKEYRFCIDFRNLNKITEIQTFPMPNLEEELCKMNGSKIFSCMDIFSAFHQIKLNKNDREKTAFTAGHRKFHFKRMPFGLRGSPITWQFYLTEKLGALLTANVMAYMDDIMAYNKTIEGHEKTLRAIFLILRDCGLKLKIEKTKLFAREIKYLGHIINESGIKPDERNIEAIKKFPVPKKLVQLQSFLGMASYFRKFIRNFAKKAAPLHQLCRKDVEFIWNEMCQEAFEALKNALITAPVLAYPDYSKTFYISVDASNFAVGAYISNEPPNNDRPIEFFSKALSTTQQNYSTTHKELLAIILAIERFQHYIWGKHFVMHTDHQALTYLFSQNKVGSRLLRWKLALAEYDFDIIHRKGKNNVVSDCLSRIKEDSTPISLSDISKNPTINLMLRAITRSRTKERQLIQQETADVEKSVIRSRAHVSEEPSVSFDIKKYEKIYFIFDSMNHAIFKKLQLKLKSKIKLDANCLYEINGINTHFSAIPIPNFNFKLELLESKIIEMKTLTTMEKINRIAVNIGISSYRTYAKIKEAFRRIFDKTEVAITFYLGTQVELTDIDDIQEVLQTYHSSLLGGHRGIERMKNTIKKYFTWPAMGEDIKKFVSNCPICEKTKINKHTHTPLQITSVANAPFEKIYIDFVGEINPNSLDGHKHLLTISCDLTKYLIMVPTFDCTAETAARMIVEHVCLVYNIPKIIVSDNGPAFIAEIFKQIMKLLRIKHTRTTPYHPQSNGAIERYHRTLGQYIRAYAESEKENWHKYTIFFTFSYNNTVHSATGFAPHTLVFGYEVELPTTIKNSRPDYNYESYRRELLMQLKNAQKRAREMIEKRKTENKAQYDKKTTGDLQLSKNDLVLLYNDVKKHKFDNNYTGPFRVEEIISRSVTKIKKGNKSVIVHNDKLKKAKANHGANTPKEIE